MPVGTAVAFVEAVCPPATAPPQDAASAAPASAMASRRTWRREVRGIVIARIVPRTGDPGRGAATIPAPRLSGVVVPADRRPTVPRRATARRGEEPSRTAAVRGARPHARTRPGPRRSTGPRTARHRPRGRCALERRAGIRPHPDPTRGRRTRAPGPRPPSAPRAMARRSACRSIAAPTASLTIPRARARAGSPCRSPGPAGSTGRDPPSGGPPAIRRRDELVAPDHHAVAPERGAASAHPSPPLDRAIEGLRVVLDAGRSTCACSEHTPPRLHSRVPSARCAAARRRKPAATRASASRTTIVSWQVAGGRHASAAPFPSGIDCPSRRTTRVSDPIPASSARRAAAPPVYQTECAPAQCVVPASSIRTWPRSGRRCDRR